MESELFTPTTEDVWLAYYDRHQFAWDRQVARDEFDRWLRAHDVEKWEEGFMACAAWWEIHHAQHVLTEKNPHIEQIGDADE